MESLEVEIIDCGQATAMTKGLFFGGFMEGSHPPYSYCPNPYGADCYCYPDNGCFKPPKDPHDPLAALRSEYEAHEGLKKY